VFLGSLATREKLDGTFAKDYPRVEFESQRVPIDRDSGDSGTGLEVKRLLRAVVICRGLPVGRGREGGDKNEYGPVP